MRRALRGSGWVLAAGLLATLVGPGFPGAAWAEGPRGDLIPREQVTARRIAEVFRGAFLDAAVDKDGDVRVTEEGGYKVYFRIYGEQELLGVYALFRFKKGTSRRAQLELANTLNDQTLLVRYSVTGDGILYADYYLPYSGGVRADQLVRSYRWFLKALRAGLARYDTDDIVE